MRIGTIGATVINGQDKVIHCGNGMTNIFDDKAIVKKYFNATGFDRWRRIYGEDDVNKVQQDIRTGHQQTIHTVMEWLKYDGNLADLSVCDAGCGVGSLSIPLAAEGAIVSASDISDKMVGEAKEKATKTLEKTDNITFGVQDLEALTGKYHTVCCIDVLIHYPQEDAAKMISHLASLAEERLILSFAPKTVLLCILKENRRVVSWSQQNYQSLSTQRS